MLLLKEKTRLRDEYERYVKSRKDVKSENELYHMYDDMLNDIEQTVIIGIEYSTARALKLIDPTRYGCGFNDYTDGQWDETDIKVNVDQTLYVAHGVDTWAEFMDNVLERCESCLEHYVHKDMYDSYTCRLCRGSEDGGD